VKETSKFLWISHTLIIEFRISVAHIDNRFFA